MWETSEHLPIVAAAGLLAGWIEVGRFLHWQKRRRGSPSWSSQLRGCASGAILASGAGVIATGIVVERLHHSPWLAFAIGSAIGVTVNMATRSDAWRLVGLALRITSRTIDDAASRETGERPSGTPSDSSEDS